MPLENYKSVGEDELYNRASPSSTSSFLSRYPLHDRPRTAPGSGSYLFDDPGKSRYKSSRPTTSSWDVESPAFRDKAFSEAFKSKRDIRSPRTQAWDEPASRNTETSPPRDIDHFQRGASSYERSTSRWLNDTTSPRHDPISGMSSRLDSGPSHPRHGTTTSLLSRFGTTPPRHDPNTGLSSRWNTGLSGTGRESTASMLSRVDNEMARLKQAAPMRASDNKNSTFDSSADTLGGNAFSTAPSRPRQQPTAGLSSRRSPGTTSRLRHEPTTVLPSRWSPGQSSHRHKSAFSPSPGNPKYGASGIDPTLESSAFSTTRYDRPTSRFPWDLPTRTTPQPAKILHEDPTVSPRTTPAWLMKDPEPTNVTDTEINRTRRSRVPAPSWLSDGTAAGIAFQPIRWNDRPADSDEHSISPENTPEIIDDNAKQTTEILLPEIIDEIPLAEIIATPPNPSKSSEEQTESNDKPEEPNKIFSLPEQIITAPTPKLSPTKTVETQTEDTKPHSLPPMISTGKIVASKQPIIFPTASGLYAPTDTSPSRMRRYCALLDTSLPPTSTSIWPLSTTEEDILRTNYQSNFRLMRVGYLKELYSIYKKCRDLVRQARKECERQTQLLSNPEVKYEKSNNKKSKSTRRVKQTPINQANDITDTVIKQCHELVKDITSSLLLEIDSEHPSKQPGFDNPEDSDNELKHYQVGKIIYSRKSLYGQLEFPDKPVEYATNEQARVLHEQVNAAHERVRTLQEHVDSIANLLHTSQDYVNSAGNDFEDATNERVRSLQEHVNSVAKVFEELDTVHDKPDTRPSVVTHTNDVNSSPLDNTNSVQENECSSPSVDATAININREPVPRIGCLAAVRHSVRNFRKGCAGSAWGRFFRCCRPRRRVKISVKDHDQEFDDVFAPEPNAVGGIECTKDISHPIEGDASSTNNTFSKPVKVPKVGKHTRPVMCQSSDENTEQNDVTIARISSNENTPDDDETLAELTDVDSEIVSPPKLLKRKRNKKSKKKREPLSPICELSCTSKRDKKNKKKRKPLSPICELSSNPKRDQKSKTKRKPISPICELSSTSNCSKASPKPNVSVHYCISRHEEAKALEKQMSKKKRKSLSPICELSSTSKASPKPNVNVHYCVSRHEEARGLEKQKSKKKRKPISPIFELASTSKASHKPNVSVHYCISRHDEAKALEKQKSKKQRKSLSPMCELSSTSKASPKPNVNVHYCISRHEEASGLEQRNVQTTFMVHSDSDNSINGRALISNTTYIEEDEDEDHYSRWQ